MIFKLIEGGRGRGGHVSPYALPRARAHHASVEWCGHLVLCGGEEDEEGGNLDDTWIWDLGKDRWLRLPAVFPGGQSRVG